MLSLMRKHAGTWMIKVILGAIVIVFVFWGVGSYTSQRSARVASVNGDVITIEEYRASYDRLLSQMRRNFGNNLSDEMIRSLGLEKQALEQLVDRRLMLQAAERLDIRVPDSELVASIRTIDAFQAAGNFSPDRYRRVLSLNRISPEDFEATQREDIAIAKLNTLITGSAKVSDLEVESVFRAENASVDVNYLFFDPARYGDISPDEEAIRAYFQKNREKYKTEPMRKASYIHFDPESYYSQVEVAEDDIAAYYENNIEKFKEPETVEARHILIKVDQQAGPQEDQKAKKRIEEILEMAKSGQDFAELAKKFSEGPSKDRGGYLGSFRREVMVKPFADKAFSTMPGQISDPVRTQFGWHIIKVEKYNPAKTKSLEEAKAEIEQQLVEERAAYMAYDQAEAVFAAVFDGDRLESLADARQLTVETTDFFPRSEPPEKVGDGAQFAQTAFELPLGDISEAKELGGGYYLIKPTEEKPARIPELEEVMDKVKADLAAELSREAAAEDARQALEELKSGAEMAAVASNYGLTPENTGHFKRNDDIEGIGREAAIATAAFNLTADAKLPEDVVETGRGFYVLALRDRKPADPAELEEKQQTIRQRLLQQKQYRAVEAWLQNQKEKSEISIEPNFNTG